MLTLRRLLVGFLLLGLFASATPVIAGMSGLRNVQSAIRTPQTAVQSDVGSGLGSTDWMGDAPLPGPGAPAYNVPQYPVIAGHTLKSPSLFQFVLDFLFSGYLPGVGLDWMGDAPKPPRPR